MKYKLKQKFCNMHVHKKTNPDNPRKCKHGKCKTNLMYILRAIVMLFLRANVIPVNPQIHALAVQMLIFIGTFY
jgi:hypothetical protein